MNKTASATLSHSLNPRFKTLLSILKATHFMPCITVTAFTTLLAYRTGQRSEILLLVPAILFGQFSVGWCNDYLDRDRDVKVNRLDKPIAVNDVSAQTIRRLLIISLIISIIFSLSYSPIAGALHMLALLSAFAYNFGLKSSRWSVATYMVSFGLLPVIVGLGSRPSNIPSAWFVLSMAFLGAAIHFLNVIPDLEQDKQTGVKGLPHFFTIRHGLIISMVILTLSLFLVFWGQHEYTNSVSFIQGIFYLLATGIFVYQYKKSNQQVAFKIANAMTFLTGSIILSLAHF